MFDKLFRRRKVTKTTTAGGKTETTTVEDVAGDPAAEAEAQRVLAEADNLFAHADEIFAAMGYVPPTGPYSKAAKEKAKAGGKTDAPPDFLSAAPGSAVIAELGTRNVFRYRGRYYAWSSKDVTQPAGYYALDTMRPTEGQP
jgi:hypothetical protein